MNPGETDFVGNFAKQCTSLVLHGCFNGKHRWRLGFARSFVPHMAYHVDLGVRLRLHLDSA